MIVGGLFVYAAITHDAKKSGGLDQALFEVLDQPFGPVLLGAGRRRARLLRAVHLRAGAAPVAMTGRSSVDVVVLGLGAGGEYAARKLAEAGLDVVGVERDWSAASARSGAAPRPSC